MAISLRVVVLVLVIIVGVAATLIALLPVRDAGLSAVRSTASLLRVEISQRIAGDLATFFQAPMYGISQLRDQFKTGYLGNTNNSLVSTIPAVTVVSSRLKVPVYIANPGDEFAFASARAASTSAYFWYSGRYYRDNQTHTYPPAAALGDFDATVDLNTFAWAKTAVYNFSDYRPTRRPWYAAVAARQQWGPVYVEWGSTTTTTTSPGGPFFDANGNLVGVAVADVRNGFLLDYFQNVDIAKTGRAMLLHSDSRGCLGGNWNESTVYSVNDTYSSASRLRTVHELVEPLFAQTVRELGEEILFNATLPYSHTYGGKHGGRTESKDIVYVDIVQIEDEFGLDMRLVVMIPEKDFLADVDRQVNVVVGAVVGAVVGLLLLAFIITALMLQPLSALEEKMYAVASFQEEEEEEGPSIISEVANIQNAFTQLRKELKKVKSYLPRSILVKLEREFEEEDEEGDLADGGEEQEHSQEKSMSMSRSARPPSNQSHSHSETMSRQSYRSHKSKGTSGVVAGRMAHGVFADDSVGFKKCTVVFVNMLSSHNKMKSDWRGLQRNQQELLEAVQAQTKKFKGVVDGFQGDHVVVTFNAVLSVASHQSKAANFSLTLLNQFSHGFEADRHKQAGAIRKKSSTVQEAMDSSRTTTAELTAPLTFGIASGDCLVGNMGTDGFKRFNIIGTAFTSAMILERLCKQFKTPILTNQTSASGMTFDTFVDAIGAFEFPGAKTATGPTKASVVYSVRGSKAGNANDEWMYDLKAREEKDMGLALNTAWVKFVTEGTEDASSDLTATKAMVTELITKSAQADRETHQDDNDAPPMPGRNGAADGKKSTPSTLTAVQRSSLVSLADAVNKVGASLDNYLNERATKYYHQAVLPMYTEKKVE